MDIYIYRTEYFYIYIFLNVTDGNFLFFKMQPRRYGDSIDQVINLLWPSMQKIRNEKQTTLLYFVFNMAIV